MLNFRKFLLPLLLFLLSAPVWAQQNNAPTVTSPVIGNDNITFSIYAPRASEVSIVGDWMATRAPLALRKNDEGVWSVTVSDLTPDYYSYTLTVDGVRTLDPVNPEIKQGIRGVENMVYLQGKESEFEDNLQVPHGQVRKVWYYSDTLGMQRRMHVYTPPGYDESGIDYPVLYLLHGAGDEDSGWSTIGRAGFILDNLIASGDAVPMLIVMPNGSLPANGRDKIEQEMMTDIIPEIESGFRVLTDSDHRAIAGLSMGGGHTTRIFSQNPAKFAYASIWSAGIFGGDVQAFENQNSAFLSDADTVNDTTQVFSVVVGVDDFAYPGSKALSELLDKHGIEHDFIETAGGHTWINWRAYLNNYAALLFK